MMHHFILDKVIHQTKHLINLEAPLLVAEAARDR
jgi:hypothetical protein